MGIKIYIFHYHLLSGGVTDVIRMSTIALLSRWFELERITLVCGRGENLKEVVSRVQLALSPDLREKVDSLILPGIDYSENINKPMTTEALAFDLKKECGNGDDQVIWWVHNYHLGKNPRFTSAVIYAAEVLDQKVVLHIHDFPECSRFENLNALSEIDNLRGGKLYLRHRNIRYAVINQRDYHYLLDAGLKEDELFLINNPVPPSHLESIDKNRLKEELFQRFGKQFPAFDRSRPLFFYPVRTIRRKNILETGFLMLLLKDRPNLIVSLPGYSPSEKGYSDLVQKAFEEGLIPGMWGIGAEEESEWVSYRNLQRGCDAIVSGSVQEGFGYMFVNTLHWQKPLLARYLDIIDGFDSLFDGYPAMFYHQLRIPLTASECDEVRLSYQDRIASKKIAIPKQRKVEVLERLEKMLEGEGFDFSYLSAEMQLRMLRKIQEPDFLKSCQKINHKTLNDIERNLSLKPIDRESDIEVLFGEKGLVETYKQVIDSFGQEWSEGESPERQVSEKLVIRFSELDFLRLIYD